MKKLIFAILLFLSVFADSYSQQSIRIGAGNIYYIGGDSNYFRFNKQGFFSFGLKTIGTSYMHGQLQFPNADGILLTGGNVTLNDGGNINVNGGGYFLDGVNITTLFPSLSGRNTWTKWNKFDTLGVGSSAYFTFGSSTVTLNNAGFYAGTLGTADLTVGHELNVTGASITGFNAVKISVDTITAPDEIVNIYGGLNVLAGGYPIFGRTENQNVSFTRHHSDGDLLSFQISSTGPTLSYWDSTTNATTSLKVGNGTITANDSAIATRNWVNNNAKRPYKIYTAILNQTGTDAPVATVTENTLGGTVVWSYVGVGDYQATLTSAYTVNKTWLYPSNTVLQSADSFAMLRLDANTVQISCMSNNNLSDFPIEIRIYY